MKARLLLASALGLALFVPMAASAEIVYGAPPPPPYGGSPPSNYGSMPPPNYGGGSCPPGSYASAQGCICTDTATFYGPSGPGYNVHLQAPGVHVVGYPVEVASGSVYVQGAPIYVDAPPVHVASPQIYLARPKVYVRPGQVSVEPPTVHVDGCENGNCEATGQSYPTAAPPTPGYGGSGYKPRRRS